MIVSFRKGVKASEWLADHGYKPEDIVTAFGRIAVFKTGMPLPPSDDILDVEDGDKVLTTTDQALSFGPDWSGDSWPLARVIRRAAPWDVDHLRHPINTFFTCARDGSGVDIYFLDSGINTSHIEFSGGRFENTYFPFGLGEGHGSMTASASAGNTCGVARGALVFCFQWINSTSGFLADALTALGQIDTHYAGRAGLNRPAVLAMEFDGTGSSSAFEAAVSDLIDDGMVCLGAAGNAGAEISSGTHYPMTYTDVICVGGIGPADLPGYFLRPNSIGGLSRTNWGARVDVMAPGQLQRCAQWDDNSNYVVFGGSTSGALAVAAGVVACMLEGHGRLSTRTEVQAVRNHVISTATTGALRNPAGYGMTTLPDRILYLDPVQVAPETITGI